MYFFYIINNHSLLYIYILCLFYFTNSYNFLIPSKKILSSVKKIKRTIRRKKYRNISVRISKEGNIICLNVDGSQTNKDTFEI